MNWALPDTRDLYLAYVGMETDLIFTHGMDLPGFASFPLLETDDGRLLLRSYFTDMIALGRRHSTGVILESPTWVANRDRGAALGYSAARLAVLNRQAIAMMSAVRAGDNSVVLSANIGPRADAYAPAEQMSVDEAEAYHAEQLAALSGTDVDVISGYTLAYAAEAAGLVRAAKAVGLPVVIAFTVETDGRLPTGMTLAQAIAEVDAQTDGYTAYFMINCAHPDHFSAVLDGAPWMARVQGVVANASRCSHAELDEAAVLDDGNPRRVGRAAGRDPRTLSPDPCPWRMLWHRPSPHDRNRQSRHDITQKRSPWRQGCGPYSILAKKLIPAAPVSAVSGDKARSIQGAPIGKPKTRDWRKRKTPP